MAKKRGTVHNVPESNDIRENIWYRAWEEIDMNFMRPNGLTVKDFAELFGLTLSQVGDIVGRRDKMRIPTAIMLHLLETTPLPDGMRRPNVYYILTGHRKSPGHESVCKFLEKEKGKNLQLSQKIKETEVEYSELRQKFAVLLQKLSQGAEHP